ncbi:acidic leucine-rich nuclear phosphoprotein 32 family member A-like [Cucumis melo var. makuwa]|uniref:Acidic leucine-rich nuclear phosphoprotein 32 family member A-like n=1 Tax=Cucumis melo var. makuwa TaxID=1194695 RepID=A0A5D3E4N3_CUCMM|nr:acidic leucine-rich nuclear phosphoprotein 32 family member A-like [Cucumis melo var. makuwa]
MVVGESSTSESEDNNFYGVLDEVISMAYPMGPCVWQLKYRWVNMDKNRNHRTHMELGYKSINTSHFWFPEEPIILSILAYQVFYIDEPKNGTNWKVVQELNTISSTSSVGDTSDASQPTAHTPRRQSTAGTPVSAYLEVSQPLSRDEICESSSPDTLLAVIRYIRQARARARQGAFSNATMTSPTHLCIGKPSSSCDIGITSPDVALTCS